MAGVLVMVSGVVMSNNRRRFAGAVVASTLEGQTIYRDTCRMLGVSMTQTLNNLGREVGMTG